MEIRIWIAEGINERLNKKADDLDGYIECPDFPLLRKEVQSALIAKLQMMQK